VNKDAESLLRLGLPIDNPAVRKLQNQLETAGGDVKVKRIGSAIDGFKKSRETIKSQGSAILSSVRPSEKSTAQKLLSEIDAALEPALSALSEQSGQGSVQERGSLDKAITAQASATHKVSELEELMVPEGFKVAIPDEFRNLPALQGRAVVEMVVKKGEAGEQFNVEGELFEKAVLRMVVDGYNSPLTGGNFVDLVNKGFYNNMAVMRSDGFVVQTGDPEGPSDGYVQPGEKKPRTIPLEIMVRGDKGPMWGSTTEEDMRGASATVLPFQSFGALGMARTEDDDDSGSSQFFWLLFDSDLTPAGKNLLDGAYACFGYTTEGAEFLKDVKEGDVIVSAKVVSGLENLVLPKEATPQ
jgi:cyclophilin family peptidyl-prolyl cis-trans isomerase